MFLSKGCKELKGLAWRQSNELGKKQASITEVNSFEARHHSTYDLRKENFSEQQAPHLHNAHTGQYQVFCMRYTGKNVGKYLTAL